MTLPFEYQNPTLQFERFMVDARDCAGLQPVIWALFIEDWPLDQAPAPFGGPDEWLAGETCPMTPTRLQLQRWQSLAGERPEFGRPARL
jgi:hypothetical protein